MFYLPDTLEARREVRFLVLPEIGGRGKKKREVESANAIPFIGGRRALVLRGLSNPREKEMCSKKMEPAD